MLSGALPKPDFAAHPEVMREIQRLVTKETAYIRQGLKRRARYDQTLTEAFQAEAVPPELANIALIESNFDPTARGANGARGMWQFKRGTAAIYGLKAQAWRDEREDVALSSVAAAQHLRDLYLLYRDWYFALAAYNAGTGRINGSSARHRTFWEAARAGSISPSVVRFVQRTAAACVVMSDPERFGFKVD